MKLLLVIGAILIAALAVKGGTDTPTPSDGGASGTAMVTGTEYERDSNTPATGIHYADCRAADGSEYRVVVSANVEYSLRSGQPCPDGPHVPTRRQQNPGLFDEISSALNAPLPYNGGDPNGPCSSWGAADKADADQMRAAYDKCMATHH